MVRILSILYVIHVHIIIYVEPWVFPLLLFYF